MPSGASTKSIPVSVGKRLRGRVNASIPPADAPIPTMGKRWRCARGVDGSGFLHGPVRMTARSSDEATRASDSAERRRAFDPELLGEHRVELRDRIRLDQRDRTASDYRIDRIRIAGSEYDRHTGKSLSNKLSQCYAVLIRHDHIREHEIDVRTGIEHSQRIVAGRRTQDAAAKRLGDNQHGGIEAIGIVVDDEHDESQE